MIQHHTLEDNENENKYLYDGTMVTIITVFTDNEESIALVESDDGEVFEVPKDQLRQ